MNLKMRLGRNWGQLAMKYKLSEIMDIIGGGTPKTNYSEYWNGDIPWLSVKDFNNDRRYVYETEKSITEAGLNNSSTKLLHKDDTIISARGTVGEVAMIPFPMAFNQSCYGLRAKEGIVIPAFLYYLVKHNVDVLRKNTHGSVFNTITRNTFDGIEVEVPSLKQQETIAGILEDLDDKIQLNIEINKNLFQQAQAIYKNRFIDLQPFDGLMPEDWHLGTVSEIIELHDSKRIPLSSRERANLAKIYPYYGATSVMDYVDRYLFDGIYLLLGEDGTVVDSKGFPILQYVEGKFWVNNHAHIITGKNGFTVEMLYLLFSLTSVQSIVTGAVQPKISQTNLNKVPVVIPSKAELCDLDSIVQPIFAQIRNLRAENDRLATIRDTLLPRLMSGELDVSGLDL